MKHRVISDFKGKVLHLCHKTMGLPGKSHKMRVEFIQHGGAAGIIPLLSQTKVVLVRQYRPVIEKYIYEIPAGTIDPGETPLQCAKREVIEEAGYAAKSMKKIGVIHPVPGYSTEVITLFKAEGLTPVDQHLDADEVLTPKIFTKSEIRALIGNGKITDSKTLAAFAFIGWL